VSTDELKELLSTYVARRVASKLVAPPSPRRTDMEETGDGANPRKLGETNPGHMHRSPDLRNISLKFLCES
jgi:hypothetical protein